MLGLPEADITGPFEKSPGVQIDASWLGNAAVNILFGDNVPDTAFTIVSGGRGSLIMPREEFDDLLACMVKIKERYP